MAAHRRGWIIGGALAVLLVAVLAVVLPRTKAMPVKDIEVRGAQQLSTEEVAAATGIAPGTPMGAVDTHAAAVSVAGLPWVETVTVSRGWPSTITVDIAEHTAVAFFTGGDGAHLINADGDEFAVDDPPPGAVEITGDAARGASGDSGGSSDSGGSVLRDAVEVAASLSEPAREAVKSLEARSPHTFVLHLADGATVVWGANGDNANKALALDTVLQREGSEFNISNPGQITVR